MFGFISKKKLRTYMLKIKRLNSKTYLGADYTEPISEKQQKTNLYAQGYEDGTDNFYNALCGKFKLER